MTIVRIKMIIIKDISFMYTNTIPILEVINIISDKLLKIKSEPEAKSVHGIAAIDELSKRLAEITFIGRNTDEINPSVITDLQILSYNTLAGYINRKSVSVRRKTLFICRLCNSVTREGCCTNSTCGYIETSSISMPQSKSKPRIITTNVKDFRNELERLLARLPIHSIFEDINPPATKSNLDLIREELEKNNVSTEANSVIPEKAIRNAMRSIKLQQEYIWVNTVRYYITGYRPLDPPKEVKEYMADTYQWALSMFNVVEKESKEKYPCKRTNLWNIQSFIRLIIESSIYLRNHCSDLLEVIHRQQVNTERYHQILWDKMVTIDNKTFREK